ncbi:hypothetical protein VTO42DRAFT_5990 [Malbranchea cinnamomea]
MFTIPDYFRTEPGPFAGPTKTGASPFLAQTLLVPAEGLTCAPNNPLQTQLPFKNSKNCWKDRFCNETSIFEHMGHLSPYQPSQSGFGANEYALPPGSNITQVHVLHRHGSRYPTETTRTSEWVSRIVAHRGEFSGELEFLNNWSYELGLEMLALNGHQELFDSGILHRMNYGRLYNSSARFVCRTTTKYRMLESAGYFLLGFFGPNWRDTVILEQIIEEEGFNNTLAGNKACPKASDARQIGFNATHRWKEKYLANATRRLRQYSGKYNWSVNDTLYAQTMCPYETVALGFSPFCLLFTWEEWLGFEYSVAIEFMANACFSSPVGRAMGIGYVVEFLSRVEGHTVNTSTIPLQINMTLSTNPVTFPVNQSLYFDFGHDTSITSVLAAFGVKQFAQFLPTAGPPSNMQFISSQIIPFAARLVIEIITAPRPVSEKRSRTADKSPYDMSRPAKKTKYVHLILNQRTIPLGRSFEECGLRDDGWCELETFMDIQKKRIGSTNFEYSCFGNYTLPKYGEVTDGAPPEPTQLSSGDRGSFSPQASLDHV